MIQSKILVVKNGDSDNNEIKHFEGSRRKPAIDVWEAFG